MTAERQWLDSCKSCQHRRTKNVQWFDTSSTIDKCQADPESPYIERPWNSCNVYKRVKV